MPNPSSSSSPPPAATFQSIQALRFIAALFVVLTHATFYVSNRLDPQFGVWGPGAAGVDLFFVISGFVMILSSQRLLGQPGAARAFVGQRIVRIVPLYWLVTTLKLIIVLAAPAVALNGHVDVLHVVASYLFLPAYNARHELEPLLGVGWTLNFEMFFYACFALALWCRRSPIAFLVPIFIGLSLIGVLRPAHGPAWLFWCNPLVLEFLAGMLIAQACLNGRRLSPAVSTLAIGAGVALLLADLGWFDPIYRALRYGLPAAAIVAGLVGLERTLGPRVPRWLAGLGASSYALYLIHPLLLPAVPAVFAKLGWQHPVIAVVASLALAIVAGHLVHRLVEQPLTDRLKSRLTRRTTGVTMPRQADATR